LHDHNLLKDTLLQHEITKALVHSQENISYSIKNVFKAEVSQTEELWCSKCLDSSDHSDSTEFCSDYYNDSSYQHRLVNFNIGALKIRKTLIFIVGTNSISHVAPGKYNTLNLSIPNSMDYTHANGYLDGKPIIRSSSEVGQPNSNFKDIFVPIGKICGMISPQVHSIFVIEYKPSPNLNVNDRQELFLDILSFVEQVLIVKQRTRTTIVLTPPVISCPLELNGESYVEAVNRVALIQGILVLVCSKVFLPVLPHLGEINAVGLFSLEQGPCSEYSRHRQEPLFNRNKTNTRELRHRLAAHFSLLGRAWGRVIAQTPALKAAYEKKCCKGIFRVRAK
jgi:hypothetical protein